MNMPPEPPAEGVLIESARRDAGLSVREAARRAGISEGWWRQVVKGSQSLSGGAYGPVRDVPAATVARMALAVYVTPEQMATAGERPDAAEAMRQETMRQMAAAPPARLSPAAELPDPDEDDTDPPMSPAMKAQAYAHFPDIKALVARATDLAAVEDPDHPVPRGAHLVQAGAAPNEGPRWDLLTEAGAKARWSRRKVMIFMAIGRVRDGEHRAQQQGRSAAGLILTRG